MTSEARDRSALIQGLTKLKARHGEVFDEVIAAVVEGKIDLLPKQKRGRKREYTDMALQGIWQGVEARRRTQKITVTKACELLAKRGGIKSLVIEDGTERHHDWTMAKTIQRGYYRAKDRLKECPELLPEWEEFLSIRLEARAPDRTMLEVWLERQTPEIRQSVLDEVAAMQKKSR